MNKQPTSDIKKEGNPTVIALDDVKDQNSFKSLPADRQPGTMETPVSETNGLNGNGKTLSDEHLVEWHQDLTILHRGHWDAARRYESRNFLFGILTAITAAISGAISGTGAVSEFIQQQQNQGYSQWFQFTAAFFAIAATILASVQTYFRASEFALRHKQAANKYGKLRRNLEEHLDLKVFNKAVVREEFFKEFLKEWGTADEESLPLPPDLYRKVKSEAKKEERLQIRRSTGF